ncbi:MAG: TIGR04282 family arsenosugar biosynthesis glycosyltransferase [Pseudomonadota bacterium]
MPRTVIVMVKEPRPGRVKTRLGRDIGMPEAAWWFRHQVAGLLRRICDPRWQVILAVSPDRDGMLSRVWPRGFARIPQGTGDLGDRMVRAMHAAPRGPVVVIGADIPGITRGTLAEAFAALGSADAVIGPASDGGYWLIGARLASLMRRGVLGNVRWSTEHACADTRTALSGLRLSEIRELYDVDRVADLALR